MRYRELLTESNDTFVLNPKCNPDNYQITGSFRDADKWRAKSMNDVHYRPEAGGLIKAGSWTEILYVMISKEDNTIVPISRSDEHHRGIHVLHDLKIPSSQYIPINVRGNNYLYPADMQAMKIVLAKYIKWGGNKNAMLIGQGDLDGIKMTVGDFVAGGPVQKHSGEGLTRHGQALVDALLQCGDDLRSARSDSNPRLLNTAKRSASNLLKLISSFGDYSLGVSMAAASKWQKDIKNADSEQALSEIVFGFGGIKNTVHDRIREVKNDPKSWMTKEVESFWGNTDLAFDTLGRM